jgi:hypothetical protein
VRPRHHRASKILANRKKTKKQTVCVDLNLTFSKFQYQNKNKHLPSTGVGMHQVVFFCFSIIDYNK